MLPLSPRGDGPSALFECFPSSFLRFPLLPPLTLRLFPHMANKRKLNRKKKRRTYETTKRPFVADIWRFYSVVTVACLPFHAIDHPDPNPILHANVKRPFLFSFSFSFFFLPTGQVGLRPLPKLERLVRQWR